MDFLIIQKPIPKTTSIAVFYFCEILFFSEKFSYHIENHPAWKEIDLFECGFSASDRIIGGLNAALGQFPWMARLGYTGMLKNVA